MQSPICSSSFRAATMTDTEGVYRSARAAFFGSCSSHPKNEHLDGIRNRTNKKYRGQHF